MAKFEELKNPHFVPYEGELRFILDRDDGDNRQILQQYQSRHGWHDVPTMNWSETPKGGATSNARNT